MGKNTALMTFDFAVVVKSVAPAREVKVTKDRQGKPLSVAKSKTVVDVTFVDHKGQVQCGLWNEVATKFNSLKAGQVVLVRDARMKASKEREKEVVYFEVRGAVE